MYIQVSLSTALTIRVHFILLQNMIMEFPLNANTYGAMNFREVFCF